MSLFRNYLLTEVRKFDIPSNPRVYKGAPLEKGGTSIQGREAPSLRDLVKSGFFKKGDTILDYGAGKYARNADFLRDQGYTVYAYDPFNGKSGVDGFEKGNVSNIIPKEKFDKGFTAYVLNVVPVHIENDIINILKQSCKESAHITRNLDIFESIKKALGRNDQNVSHFFKVEFDINNEWTNDLENGTLSDQVIYEFCLFGVQTSRGFQRIPLLDKKGFQLVKNISGYKIFKK